MRSAPLPKTDLRRNLRRNSGSAEIDRQASAEQLPQETLGSSVAYGRGKSTSAGTSASPPVLRSERALSKGEPSFSARFQTSNPNTSEATGLLPYLGPDVARTASQLRAFLTRAYLLQNLGPPVRWAGLLAAVIAALVASPAPAAAPSALAQFPCRRARALSLETERKSRA
jgi:hypothetical protein